MSKLLWRRALISPLFLKHRTHTHTHTQTFSNLKAIPTRWMLIRPSLDLSLLHCCDKISGRSNLRENWFLSVHWFRALQLTSVENAWQSNSKQRVRPRGRNQALAIKALLLGTHFPSSALSAQGSPKTVPLIREKTLKWWFKPWYKHPTPINSQNVFLPLYLRWRNY